MKNNNLANIIIAHTMNIETKEIQDVELSPEYLSQFEGLPELTNRFRVIPIEEIEELLSEDWDC